MCIIFIGFKRENENTTNKTTHRTIRFSIVCIVTLHAYGFSKSPPGLVLIFGALLASTDFGGHIHILVQ